MIDLERLCDTVYIANAVVVHVDVVSVVELPPEGCYGQNITN